MLRENLGKISLIRALKMAGKDCQVRGAARSPPAVYYMWRVYLGALDLSIHHWKLNVKDQVYDLPSLGTACSVVVENRERIGAHVVINACSHVLEAPGYNPKTRYCTRTCTSFQLNLVLGLLNVIFLRSGLNRFGSNSPNPLPAILHENLRGVSGDYSRKEEDGEDYDLWLCLK